MKLSQTLGLEFFFQTLLIYMRDDVYLPIHTVIDRKKIIFKLFDFKEIDF